ncbi:MAG: DUF885 domain-containing protein [Myxococcota bacterium]
MARAHPKNTRFEIFLNDAVRELAFHQPVAASIAGLHELDAHLDDLTPQGLAHHFAAVGRLRRALERFDRPLAPGQMLDRLLLSSKLDALAHLLETVRPWAWNPDYWTETAGEGVNALIAHHSGDPPARLLACVARLEEIPHLLTTARRQLANPPRALVTVAEENAAGAVSFYADVVPRAFPQVRARALRRKLEEASARAAEAAKTFAAYLHEKKSHASGHVGIGEAALAKKLALDEMLASPPSKLAAHARAELQRLRSRCDELAALAAKGRARGAAEVLRHLATDRPGPRAVLGEVEYVLSELERFCRDAELVTIPSGARCEVQPMPAYLTAMTVAAMDVPGPFDPEATEAKYLVTLPTPSWSKADREAALSFFNRSQVHWVTAHEAFPGHLVQLFSLRTCSSPVRRFFGTDSFIEGWAHYAEGLIFEAGYHGGEAALLLSKEHGALLRAARCVASLELHARQMTLAQAATFLEKEGLFPKPLARSEALRCAVDFSCPAYTLGRLELERLRSDARAAWGERFSVRRFHDAVMAEGQLPLPLLRAAVLPTAAASSVRRVDFSDGEPPPR